MSISEREQHVLDSIEEGLAGSGPELAAKLAVFARLSAGEPMPPRERVWRPTRAPAPFPVRAGAAPEIARPRRRFSRRTAWRLLLFAVTLAFLALAVACSHGAGKGICTVSRTAACQRAQPPAPSPGQSGAA